MKKLVFIFMIILAGLAVKAQTPAINADSLIKSDTFNIRTELLLLRSCNQIVGEDTLQIVGLDTTRYTIAQINKRHNLAMAVYADIPKYRMRFVRAIASQGSLTLNSNDGDIQFTINSVFNDIAGIKFDD